MQGSVNSKRPSPAEPLKLAGTDEQVSVSSQWAAMAKLSLNINDFFWGGFRGSDGGMELSLISKVPSIDSVDYGAPPSQTRPSFPSSSPLPSLLYAGSCRWRALSLSQPSCSRHHWPWSSQIAKTEEFAGFPQCGTTACLGYTWKLTRERAKLDWKRD